MSLSHTVWQTPLWGAECCAAAVTQADEVLGMADCPRRTILRVKVQNNLTLPSEDLLAEYD
jgi:hypothetical protein